MKKLIKVQLGNKACLSNVLCFTLLEVLFMNESEANSTTKNKEKTDPNNNI